jgi:hypothetical protein
MKLLDRPQRLITKDGRCVTNGRVVATVEQDEETHYIILTDCFNLMAPMTQDEVQGRYDVAPEYAEAIHGGFEPYEATLREFISDIKENIESLEVLLDSSNTTYKE